MELGNNFSSVPIKLPLSGTVYQNMEMPFYKNSTFAIVSKAHNSYPKEPYVQKDQAGIAKENREVFYPEGDRVTQTR